MRAIAFILAFIAAGGCVDLGRLQIGSNHKTGSRLSRYVFESLKAAPCMDKNITLHLEDRKFHWRWPLKNDGRKYLLFQRNPYSVVVSGYLYHMRAQEIWIRQPMGNVGTGAVLRQWKQYNLSRPRPSETYGNYLRRIHEREGLLAESLRCFAEEFPGTTRVAKYVREFPTPSNVRVVCLDDVMRDQSTFNATMRGIYSWVGMPCEAQLLNGIAVQGPGYGFGGNTDHVTDHGAHRKVLMDLLLYLDQAVLQQRISQAENETDCARAA